MLGLYSYTATDHSEDEHNSSNYRELVPICVPGTGAAKV